MRKKQKAGSKKGEKKKTKKPTKNIKTKRKNNIIIKETAKNTIKHGLKTRQKKCGKPHKGTKKIKKGKKYD